MISIKAFKYSGVLVIFFAVSLFAQDTINQEENQKIIEEYKEISNRLIGLQKQALSDLEIAKQAEIFSKNLEVEMVKQDSSVKRKLERREDIVDKYEKRR